MPLCERHILRVVHHARDLLTLKDPDRVEAQRADRDGVVYFLRFRDLVKIGWTSDLTRRLSTVPHDEVLHTQPGSRLDEKRLHVAFAHLREHREWFRPEPDLLDFIEHLRHAGVVGDLAS